MKLPLSIFILLISLQFYAQAGPDYTTTAFGLSKDVVKMEEYIYSYNETDQKFELTEKKSRTFENGLLKEYTSEYLTLFLSSETTKYTYNASGKILKEERTSKSSYGDSNSSVVYEYLSNRLVTIRNSNSYSTSVTNYEYDSKGKLVKGTAKDSEGKIEKILEYTNVLNEQNYTVKTSYYYSKDGTSTNVNVENYVNGKYTSGSYSSTDYGDSDYEYIYDQYGNILKSYEDDYLSEENIFEYDSKGNWFKCKSYVDDWLNGEIEEYKFRRITYKTGSIGNTNLDMNFVNKYPRTLKGTTSTTSTTEAATATTSTKSASNPGCEGDCQDGFGTYYHSDGGTYYGYHKNGLRNGPGTFTFSDDSFYSGNWINGNKEGYAMYSWKDGAVFFGYYKDNKLNGEGVYMDADKKFKGGIFKDGNFDTTYNLENNGKSTGCVSGDCQNGFGEYIYSNDDIFIGFFKYGQLSHGTYVYANADVYIGEFINSKRSGLGIFTWANESYYLGMYQNDTYHGLGYYYNTTDKSELIGEFANGSLSKNMSNK